MCVRHLTDTSPLGWNVILCHQGHYQHLETALKFLQVKWFVIFSSIASVIPPNRGDLIAALGHTFTSYYLPMTGGHALNSCWSTEKDFPEATLDTPCSTAFEACSFSKLLA